MTAATADLTKLSLRLSQSKTRVEKTAADLIHGAATEVQALAQSNAPYKTGRLRQSIQVRFETPTKAVIGPSVPYGAYQEFGTGTRGEFKGSEYVIKPKNGKMLHFKANGKWVSAKIVHHPGIPAHPYMRPAVQKVIDQLGPDLAKSVALKIVSGNA